MNIEEFVSIGNIMFGSRWIAPMARELGISRAGLWYIVHDKKELSECWIKHIKLLYARHRILDMLSAGKELEKRVPDLAKEIYLRQRDIIEKLLTEIE